MPTLLNACHKGKQLFFCVLLIPPFFTVYSAQNSSYPSHQDRTDSIGRPMDRKYKRWHKFKSKVLIKYRNLIDSVHEMERRASIEKWNEGYKKQELDDLKERGDCLKAVIINLDMLEDSRQAYVVKKISASQGEGGTMYNIKTREIEFRVGSVDNFVHETIHGGQFEKRRIAYISNGKDSISSFGDDYEDEIEAYKAQYSFCPDCFGQMQSSSNVTSLAMITKDWVQHLVINGDTPYAENGSAKIALVPVTVDSPLDTLRLAYPNNPVYKSIRDTKFTIKDYQERIIIYKH